jgi:serine/threonine-protein kinase
MTEDVLKDFRAEVRLMARMEHNNILKLKDASWIDERFVIAFPLGEKTLDQRIVSRMSQTTALELSEQMLDAVAYAHRSHIVHCDIKPENLILFPNNRLRLTDFGIAKIAHRTLRGSGTGTVGYMAPEQAMGKPSSRSDVFSVGLVMYRMLAGQWPEWPYEWPLPGYQRLRGKVHPDLIAFLRKAIELQPRKRFKDGDEMLRAYNRIRRKVYRKISTQRTARTRRRAA